MLTAGIHPLHIQSPAISSIRFSAFPSTSPAFGSRLFKMRVTIKDGNMKVKIWNIP